MRGREVSEEGGEHKVNEGEDFLLKKTNGKDS